VKIICEDDLPAAAAAGDKMIVVFGIFSPWARRTTQLDVGALTLSQRLVDEGVIYKLHMYGSRFYFQILI
jgi:hypothetical protein